MQRILEGHWRYLANNKQKRVVTEEDRALHAQGQFPFAAILGCADSRVSPELIFDQGQGDLFVVRVAGNILGTGELASLEYAVQQLGVRLVVVLGHESCGAVAATTNAGDGPGAIGFLLREIAPAVADARNQTGNLLDNAVKANVKRVVDATALRSEYFNRMISDGQLRVVGAVYRLGSGDVDVVHKIG